MKRIKSKKNILTLILLFLVSASLFGSETESSYKKVFERGPFQVTVTIDKTRINIAEFINLKIIAESAENHYEVEFDLNSKTLKGISKYDEKKITYSAIKNNSFLKGKEYRFEPESTGEYEIPEIPVKFSDPNTEKTYEILTEPAEIEVYSVIKDANEALTISPIKPPMEMPVDYEYWAKISLGTLLGIVLLILCVLFLRRSKGKQKPRILKPAHKIALGKLDKLLANKEEEHISVFYDKLSDILRFYIEDRFEINAPDRTTEEFLSEIRFSEKLNPHDKETLQEFLKHCDMVKFAKYQPEQGKVKDTVDTARNFIESTKNEEVLIDVTEETEAA